jgi:hypothetical protein
MEEKEMVTMSVSAPFKKKKHCPSHTDLNQIGPYSPSMLACSPQPPKLKAIACA